MEQKCSKEPNTGYWPCTVDLVQQEDNLTGTIPTVIEEFHRVCATVPR